MKIFPKLILTTLPPVLLFLVLGVGITYHFSRNAITDMAEAWLETRLSEAMDVVHAKVDDLQAYGLADIPAGVAMAKLDASRALSTIQVGEHGYVFAVDMQGIVAMHPDQQRVGTDVSGDAWFQELAPGRGRGTVTYTAEGQKNMVIYDVFAPWQWFVLVTDPESEIYGAAYRMKPYLVTLGIATALVMATVLMWLTHRLTRPLQPLIEGAERIGRGNLETRIALSSADEYGRLAGVFNQMAAELQASLNALQDREIRFRSLIENASDIITIMNEEGRIDYESPAVERILGFRVEELVGRIAFDFVHPDDRPAVVEAFNTHAQSTEAWTTIDFRFRHKDGSWRTLAATSRNLLHHPAVQGVVVNSRDITERQRAEAALQHSHQELEKRVAERTAELIGANTRLKQEIAEREAVIRQKETLQAQLLKAKKMEAIGTLAGGIAHDFNNLMMGIQGNASLLRLELDAHPELAERLEMIEAFVQSGAHLTRQLLGFARMGKYEVRSTDINALVRTSAEMFARTRKELHVRCNCQAEVWPVQVDRGQIEQVLLNLFINAWQSMPDGGSITIDTRNEVLDDGYSAAHGLSPGRYVRISVTDTGSGIDPAIRERIFDPFFSTKTRQRGTGLGLASAYGIIQNHGGLINVYSEPGHGSTFNIYLQASDQAPVALESPREDMLTGSETLLLVDDEPHIVSITQRMLAKLGYQVFTAEGGEAALEVVRKHRAGIDLVILDMIMPDMGGGETFDHLRRIDPEIKVLLASGYSINGEASEILARGCNGFLQKPFNLTVLSREVRRVLDGVNESV